jgi:hypothetical protein
MKIPIAFQIVSSRYPNQLLEIHSKLKNSKSKEKNVPLEEWNWNFDYCVRITNGCFKLSDIFNKGVVPKHQTPQEIYADRLNNTFCSITASKGRAWLQSSTLAELPQEIKDSWAKQKEDSIKEQKRVDSLTPNQKQEEINCLLKQLRKSPGFMEIKL